MKTYVIPSLQSFVVGFILYSYLITVKSLHLTEATSYSWLVVITAMSGLYAIFTTISVYLAGYLNLLFFKNKAAKHIVEVLMIIMVLGVFSLYLQISIGQTLFSYRSTVSPLTYVIFGFLLLFFSAYFYSNDYRAEVEVIAYGNEQVASMYVVEHYNSGLVVGSIEELKKAIKSYKTKHFILIDMLEPEVDEVVKLLAWTSADISYLYNDKKPEFTDTKVFEWELSHNFEFMSITDLKLSAIYRRGI